MKKIYLIITILFVGLYSCKAQLNELTQTEFLNIKFSNVTLDQIYGTEGDINQMKALFGNDLLTEANTTGPSLGRDFWNNNIYLNFEDDSNTGNQYSPTNIQVKNASVSVTVKGVTAKLGDDKSVFANNKAINTHVGSNNTIAFIDKLTGSALLIFKIDEISNKIIEITFNAF